MQTEPKQPRRIRARVRRAFRHSALGLALALAADAGEIAFRDVAGRVDADAADAAFVGGEVVVRYRSAGPHAVAADVAALLRAGQRFQSAMPSGSDSLDRLHDRYRVSSATHVFRDARRVDPARASAGTATSDLADVYLLRVPVGTDLIRLCEEFEADPSVAYCHPNFRFHTFHVPSDRYFDTSGAWGQSYRDLWGLDLVRAHAAWHALGSAAAPVTVAVVDTGIDYEHPDLVDRVAHNPGELTAQGTFIAGDLNADGCPGVCGVDDDGDGLVDEDSSGCGSDGRDGSGRSCVPIDDLDADDDENGFADDHIGWDFRFDDNDPADDVGHGTHVAGTIAASVDNGIGIAGVAPQARILIVRGLGPDGGSASGLAAALKYAVDRGADVINNSWGSAFAATAPDVLVDAVRYATSKGVVVVCAAGNAAAKLGGLPRGFAPASIPDSIAVAASDRFDRRSDFSNFGVGIDVAAPGGDSSDATANAEYLNVLSLRASGAFEDSILQVDDDYLRLRGTSMASPHAAGVAALIRSAFPHDTVEEVRQALRLGAADAGRAGWDADSGSGRVDAYAALRVAEPGSALIREPTTREIVSGSVAIRGIAMGHHGSSNFAGYRVEFGAGDDPIAWTLIRASAVPVADGLLATWNIPADLADAEYTLRLVVADDVGRNYESRVAVEVDQLDPPAQPGWPLLPPLGTAQLIPMIPTVADLDRDGDLEVLLGPYAWHHDGTPIVNHLFGYFADHPFALSIFQGFHGAPAVGDVDADGTPEVVLIHHDAFAASGAIHVFGADGRQRPGWPKSIAYANAIGRSATPVLADIDGDSVLDVIVFDAEPGPLINCRVSVYRGDGSVIFERTLEPRCRTTPTVTDRDGDGRPEIVVLGSDGAIAALGPHGEPAPVWPRNFRIHDAFDYSAPTAGDLDGDGGLDLLVPAIDGDLYAYSSDGLPLAGWPVRVACCDPSPAALADLDRDGQLEVIVGDRDGFIHVFDRHGAVRAGWPVRVDGPANTTPAVADVDGDGALDVVEVTGDRKVHAWDADGREITAQGWPIATGEYAGASPFQDLLGLAASPIVADLDSDGDREVVAFTGHVHAWDLPDAASALPREWPMFRANERGSGNVDEDRVATAPSGPRIYISARVAPVADIETFEVSFDLAAPGAAIWAADWSVVGATSDPTPGFVDGLAVDLAAGRGLPERAGLVTRAIRIPTPGLYQVRGSIRDSAGGQRDFVTPSLEVIAVEPASPRARIVPAAPGFARTLSGARVDFQLIAGLRRLAYRVVDVGSEVGEPVLGTFGDGELGAFTEPGERDLSVPSYLGLAIDPESPIDATFAVNEPGAYRIEISIDAFISALQRTIQVGSTQVRFDAFELDDSDADGWYDVQDNCTAVANGIGQAPASGCAAGPCVGNQVDSDGDGYGNACDADLDGDGVVSGSPGQDCAVGTSDWCALEAALGSERGDAAYRMDADCDADGRIGATDRICFEDQLGGPPGPSGFSCAGSFPCFGPSGDADADGTPNGEDNCVLVADPLRRDADADGYGDACDADYDGDGVVGFSDLAALAAAFGSSDARFDHDADGTVGFSDVTFLLDGFGRPPGPAGIDL